MISDIGTDIVFIKRLEKIITTTPNFLNKVYTKKELAIASSLENPLHFYATRFAAKEAIFKATNCQFEFNQIEILKSQDGKPLPKILDHDDIKIKLSLSYDGEYAIAFCLIIP